MRRKKISPILKTILLVILTAFSMGIIGGTMYQDVIAGITIFFIAIGIMFVFEYINYILRGKKVPRKKI